MNWLSDQYAFHVIVSYGTTALLLGALVWASVAANAKARRELEALDRERGE